MALREISEDTVEGLEHVPSSCLPSSRVLAETCSLLSDPSLLLELSLTFHRRLLQKPNDCCGPAVTALSV